MTKMAKYNFKKFFDNNKIANTEWVSNAYFAIKRLELKKSQNTFIDTFPESNSRAESIEGIVNKSISDFYKYYSKDDTEYIPTLYNSQGYKNSKGELAPAIIDNNNVAINIEYYNFIKDLGCSLVYNKGRNTYEPLMIFNKDSEIVGIVLPIRMEHEKILEAIDYNKHLEKLEVEKKQAKIVKQNSKKCLYISNNKAVVRHKELTCIAELTNDESFKNLYVESDYKKEGGNVFLDFGFILMNVSYLSKYDTDSETIKYRLESAKSFTLQDYKNYITKCLNNNQFINIADIKLMELAGESEEYIQKLKDHRQKVMDIREQERNEREVKREAEEQSYVEEQNKKAEEIISQAEQAIINKQNVQNKDVTIYKSKYESNTTSLILYLMKKHNINIPLKTQGWINRALTTITYDEEGDNYGYRYYNSSADSTTFYKYLNQLILKIKEKYGTIEQVNNDVERLFSKAGA